ncbi:MAG: dihydrodipicolinate synthase family protein [Trebonia sp.]
MAKAIEGIIPVMITPFTEDGAIDYAGLEKLINWYLAHDVDALFAVCQSSEMQYLSLKERGELGRFVVQQVGGRVPVISSGHISDDIDEQVTELTVAAETGADAVVLVTNHLDPAKQGMAAFRRTTDTLLDRLPQDMPLGLYECPAPFRRLLSDDELKYCIDSGRFVVLKDVSCDLPTVERRVALANGSPMAIVNANAAIARDAMRAGSLGFTGVFTNFHPDLYKWMRLSGDLHEDLAKRLNTFLVLAALSEAFGYPVLAKLYHQRLGTFGSIKSRVIEFDVREKFWALDAILDQVVAGTETFRAELAHLGAGAAAAA